jgi:hypothetical protein
MTDGSHLRFSRWYHRLSYLFLRRQRSKRDARLMIRYLPVLAVLVQKSRFCISRVHLFIPSRDSYARDRPPTFHLPKLFIIPRGRRGDSQIIVTRACDRSI